MTAEHLCESCQYHYGCKEGHPPRDRTRVVSEEGRVTWCTSYVEETWETWGVDEFVDEPPEVE